MTIAQLIAHIREQIAGLLATRQTHTDAIEAVRTACIAEGARDPNETEVATVRTAQEARATIDGQVAALQARAADLEAEEASDEAARALLQTIRPSTDRSAVITREARAYRPDEDPHGSRFLRDIGQAFLYGGVAVESNERLLRHMAEERVERAQYLERAAGTGAFAGLTVPQYLTDLYAPAAAALRPLADACNLHPLPADGMTVNLSRITTSTSAALQATQNTGVSETNIDDTLLTINVLTNAGQQTLSRQAIDRGTGVEAAMLDDLFRQYATTLDATLITQSVTGLSAVATSIAYTDGTPTVPELYPKFLQALAAVEAAMLDMASGEQLIVMHSRRWYWLQNALSSTWPLMTQPGIAAQMLGTNFGVKYGAGLRGVLPSGTPVIVDNNIGTTSGAGTEDEIYVVDQRECHLWEDPAAPMFIRAEQPAAASLGVLFVVYGYFAYTFSRYTQAQKIAGTGLIAPTFAGV